MKTLQTQFNLEISNKDLFAASKKMRIKLKSESASASIEDRDVRKVMNYFEKRAVEEEIRRREEEKRRAEEEARRAEEEARRRAAEEEKRRVEEERKRIEEERRRLKELEDRRREERSRAEAQARARTAKPPQGLRPSVLLKPGASAPAQPARGPEPETPPQVSSPLRQQEVAAGLPPPPSAPPRRERPAGPARKSRDSAVGDLKVPPVIEVMKLPARREGRKKGKGAPAPDALEKGPRRPRHLRQVGAVEDEIPGRRAGKGPKAPSPRIRPTIFVPPSVDNAPRVIERIPVKKKVTLYEGSTVGQFAQKAEIPAAEIIKKCFALGQALTINAVMDFDLAELVATEFEIDLEVVHEGDEYDVEEFLEEDSADTLQARPPVVTIMGHVDHGKTTLLDAMRKSDVVGQEFGGITQHIGAYHVETPHGEVIFLDTPGHEAFTAMRARGAQVTDIVVLVVAADDGVMPQTVEAIRHAQEAKVPIIVAVNKIDLPGANPLRVKQDLMQYNLLAEEFGGETIFVELSAKKRINIEGLLEMILLQSEVLELKANPSRAAVGRVVESHVDPLRGAVATVLVQKGTLRVGDVFLTGAMWGKVRAMIDDRGRTVETATPSRPVEIIGLSGSPEAGELFLVLEDDRQARVLAERREQRRRTKGRAAVQAMTLEGFQKMVDEVGPKELTLIIKGDVQGSIEAVSQALEKLSTEKVRVRVLHNAVGGINDGDVNLARTANSLIIGFNVRPDPSAVELAEEIGVEIRLYRVIYDLLEDVRKAMTGMLDKSYKEVSVGRAEVRQLFRISRVGTIAGCYVTDGEIPRDAKVRLIRDSVTVYEGKIGSLRRVKDDVKKVTQNMECGIGIENYNDVKEGDIIEAYKFEEVPVEL
ncbi:MAG: translation initiation factor IF-2 [bacterium]